jgi:hypothetical protein
MDVLLSPLHLFIIAVLVFVLFAPLVRKKQR